MSDRLPSHSHALSDLPAGWGPGYVPKSEELAAPEGAEHVGFDNTSSGLVGTNVQAVVDELALGMGPGVANSRIFYINNQIVDAPEYAARGIFHDDGSCMAWIEGNIPLKDAVVLQLSPTDLLNPHIMSDGSTWGTNGQREVVYQGTGNQYFSYLSIDTDVTLPAADPLFYPSITFKDIQVVHTAGAKLKIGAFRQFLAFNCSWSGANTLGAAADLYGDDADFTFNSCSIFRVQIDRDPLNVAGTGVSGRFIDCFLDVARDQILVDHAYYGISFEIGSIRFNATTVAVSPKLARTVTGGGMVATQATFRNTTLYWITANGATASTLLDFGVGLSLFNAFGLTIMPSINAASPAALTTSFTAINTIPGPWGVSIYASNTATPIYFFGTLPLSLYACTLFPSYTTPAAFPGFLTPVMSPPIANKRLVTFTAKCVATVAGSAGISLEVETDIGSGLYREEGAAFADAGVIRTDYQTVTAPVMGGLRFQFRDLSAGGGTATVEAKNATNGATGLSYTDQG